MSYDEYVEIYDNCGNLIDSRVIENLEFNDEQYWQILANQKDYTIYVEKY